MNCERIVKTLKRELEACSDQGSDIVLLRSMCEIYLYCLLDKRFHYLWTKANEFTITKIDQYLHQKDTETYNKCNGLRLVKPSA
jgi:hypothetical protein